MPKITYIEHDGTKHTVEAELGSTVMETALRNDAGPVSDEIAHTRDCRRE